MTVMDDTDPNVIDTSGIATDRVRQRLLPWLTKIVDSLEQEEPLAFILAQVTSLGGDKAVRTIRYDFQLAPNECVDEIVMAAIDDMEGASFKTDVAYSVTVQGREDQRFNFTLKASRGHTHDEMRRRDFFPDMQGLTGQLMEQNLQLTDKALDASGATTGILMKLLDKANEEIMFLKRGQYERDMQIQKLMDSSLKRTMMYEEHSSKLKQQEAFADGFKAMAPPIIAQLAGPQAAAMAQAFLQNGMGGNLALPGFQQGPTDEDLLDELLRLLEKSAVREKLFEVLAGDSEVFQILGELHKRSTIRREQRARQQQEESDKRSANGQNGQNDSERGAA